MKSGTQSKPSLAKSKPKPFLEIIDHQLHVHPHIGQERVLNSDKKVILVLAGNQSGKTSIGAIWMYNEIMKWDKKAQEEEVPRNTVFWAVITSYPLLNEKLLPVFKDLFISILGIGEYHVQAKTLDVTITRENGDKVTYEIHFKSAEDPNSLASATVGAMYVDECAMRKFTHGVWTELNARMFTTNANRLYTTTIYKENFAQSWIKKKIYDRWRAGVDHIDVIRFESIDNPFADLTEWEENKEILSKSDFDMRFRGIYTKPIGAIYNAFDEDRHVIEPFNIDTHCKRWVGVDPGVVNHATCWIAEIMPWDTGYEKIPHANGMQSVFVVYRTSLEGSTTTTMTNTEHVQAATQQPDFFSVVGWCGGSKSEKYFRSDYEMGGILVKEPPFTEVEAGISAVYALMKTDRLYVFSDQIKLLSSPDDKDDRGILSYSRKTDDEGNVLSDINEKEKYHILDALRYCVAGIDINAQPVTTNFLSMSGKSLLDI